MKGITMATIHLNFRVLGIYLDLRNVPIQTEEGVTLTIEGVMTQLKSLPLDDFYQYRTASPSRPGISDFDFSKSAKDGTLENVQVRYANPPKGERPAGLYMLCDSLCSNPILTWQYYVLDINKQPKNENDNFVAFGDPTTTLQLAEGDTIIWRLVSILTQPVNVTERLKARMGADPETM
jgi:hypothetical protein